MVVTSQVSLGFSENNLNLPSKNSNSLSNTAENKYSKELTSTVDNIKSNNISDKKENFKEVLESKKNNITNKNNDSEEKSELKELKDKLDKLEEKSNGNSDNKEEMDEMITSLLNTLNNLLRLNNNSEVKPEKGNDSIDISIENLGNNSLKALNKLLELLSDEKIEGRLDLEKLTDIKELLSNLHEQLSDELKDFDKIKKGLNDIYSKLTEIVDDSSNNDNNKVLTLEEILKKSYSQDENNSDSNNKQMFSGKKETSKEEKILNSLLNDNDNNSIDNKINLFSSRIQNVQGQNNIVRGLTVNKATFTQDLIKDVKYMSINNLNELTVKVNPGNLGEITIKLVQEDGLIKANLKANSKETTALLSQNLAEIKKELGDQSIKISEVNIELYNEDATFFKDSSFGGSSYQDQEKNNNDSSTNTSKNSLKIQNDNEDIFENNAEIDTTLNFLA